MTSRPTRERRQPKRDQDIIELNLELIEKLETNRRKGATKEEGLSCAKLLSNFINTSNKRIREASMLNMEEKKNASKPPHQDNIQPKQTSQFSNYPSKNKPLNAGRAQDSKPSRSAVTSKRTDQFIQKNDPKSKTQNKKKIGMIQKNEPTVVFNRAAYHVAIAYTIYLAGLKQKSMQFPDHNQLDPTYPARKLKMQQQNPQNNQ